MQTPIRPSSASFPNSSFGNRCSRSLGGVRLDLGGRELAGQRLDLPLVGCELEVHAASIWLSYYYMSVIDSISYMLCSVHGQR